MSDSDLLGLPVVEFVQRTASADATPGGGSVSAVNGALAAALVAMVGRLTAGRKGYESGWQVAERVAAQAAALVDELQAGAREDIASFTTYMEALRLPKQTEAEKSARRGALAAAMQRATAAPLAIADACTKVLRLAAELAPVANRNAVSDLGVAAHTGLAALRGALLTVQTNLTYAPKQPYFDEVAQRVPKIDSEASSFSERVLGTVRDCL